MWAILALAAALLVSFNPVLYKRMLVAITPVVVVWAVIGLALPLHAFVTLAMTTTWRRVDGVFVLAVIGSASLNAIAHLASARSLKLADASLVTPLLTLSPVFTLLLSALLFGEIPQARGMLGVAVVLGGAYWLNCGPGNDWATPFKSVARKPGVGLVLLAGLLWAVTPVFERAAMRHSFPESPLVVALLISGMLTALLTVAVVRRHRSGLKFLARRKRKWALASLIAGTAPHWDTRLSRWVLSGM